MDIHIRMQGSCRTFWGWWGAADGGDSSSLTVLSRCWLQLLSQFRVVESQSPAGHRDRDTALPSPRPPGAGLCSRGGSGPPDTATPTLCVQQGTQPLITLPFRSADLGLLSEPCWNTKLWPTLHLCPRGFVCHLGTFWSPAFLTQFIQPQEKKIWNL